MNKPRFTRSAKRAKIRQTIVEAAAELFERQGFEHTPVEDIAAEAEVSRSTFYRYFPAKEDVAFPYHAQYVAQFRELLAANHRAGSPLLTVRRAFLAMAELYMAARAEHLRYQRIIGASPSLVARSVVLDLQWEDTLAAAWRSKLGRSRSAREHAAMAAGVIMGAVHATMAIWYGGECRADLAALSEPAFALLGNGLANGAAATAGERKRPRPAGSPGAAGRRARRPLRGQGGE